jgi:hypothetical protein
MLNVGALRMLGACFNRMLKFDAVAWNDNTLNAGKVQGIGGLFNQMQWKGVQPVLVTFVGVVNGRASIYGN